MIFWRKKKKKEEVQSGDFPETPEEVPVEPTPFETPTEKPFDIPAEPEAEPESPVPTPEPEIVPEPETEPNPVEEPEIEPDPVPAPTPMPEIEPETEPSETPMPDVEPEPPAPEPEIEPIPEEEKIEMTAAPEAAVIQDVEDDISAATDAAIEPEEEKIGWLGRLSRGLSKSSSKIGQGIADLVTKRKLDQDLLDELEEVLITADLGPKTAAHLVGTFGQDRFGKDISEDEIKSLLADSISEILDPVAQPMTLEKVDGKPMVVLVCGVNGVGKTTTIGKIAYDLATNEGKKIVLGAGDTFRAAAVEQLEIWADRAKAGFVKKDLGADAAALAYESYEQAVADNADVLFIDTAGRLHNKANLMAELEKIVRVLKKHDENLPHAVLLVLDATTGQNAHAQLETFNEMVNVTGLVVTKLDGSAKGGVVVSLADQFGMPIHYIGVGETAEDLRPFDSRDFAKSLVGAVS